LNTKRSLKVLQGAFEVDIALIEKTMHNFEVLQKWKIPTLKLIFNTLNLEHFYLMPHSS
jgi:hypothetical protein